MVRDGKKNNSIKILIMKDGVIMVLNVGRLRLALYEKGWSVRKFAELAGVSEAHMSRILNKKRGAGAKSIGAIMKVLGDVPINELFFC